MAEQKYKKEFFKENRQNLGGHWIAGQYKCALQYALWVCCIRRSNCRRKVGLF